MARRTWARLAVVLVAAMAGTAPVAAELDPGSHIITLLGAYDRGEYADALAGLRAPYQPEKLLPEYEANATLWIQGAGQGVQWRRALVASAFALDLAQAVKPTPGQAWGGAALLMWASTTLHLYGPPVPAPAERWWYLAAIVELRTHTALPILAGTEGPMAVSLTFDRQGAYQRLMAKEPDGLLARARARFPDEPHFALADAEVREQLTADVVEGFSTAATPFARDALPIAELTELQQAAKAPVTAFPQSAGDQQAIVEHARLELLLARAALVPGVARDLTTLAQAEAVRGEVELHLGYLQARLQAWPDAAAHLAQVAHGTSDPALLQLADLMAGWVAEERADREAAMAAYRRALARVPGTPAASWPLAADLLMTGRSDARTEARTLLNDALHAPAAPEPLTVYYAGGDAGLLSTDLDRLRTALKPTGTASAARR